MQRPGVRRWDWSAVTLWAPVVAVAALGQAGLGLEIPWTGSNLGLAVTSLLLAAPLAARRGRPLPAAALVAVALPIQEALGGSLGFASFLAVLVAAYSLGRFGPSRGAALGCLVLLVGVVAAMRSALPEQADELVIPVFYVSAAAALGGVVGRLTVQAAELRRLNDELARERDTSAQVAVATERMRLARDLHDVVAHTLAVVVVQAENCDDAIDDDPARAHAAAREVQDAGRRGLAELRTMVGVLRDTDESPVPGGLHEVETLAAVMAGTGLEVAVRREGDFSGVPDDVGQHLARIVQEALTNVVKHSAARAATVRLVGGPDEVAVTVTDPGPALGTAVRGGGLGVIGMAERIAPFAGSVVAGPDQSGFRVHARVPLTGLAS